jgi:hypothetical protein
MSYGTNTALSGWDEAPLLHVVVKDGTCDDDFLENQIGTLTVASFALQVPSRELLVMT